MEVCRNVCQILLFFFFFSGEVFEGALRYFLKFPKPKKVLIIQVMNSFASVVAGRGARRGDEAEGRQQEPAAHRPPPRRAATEVATRNGNLEP